MVTGGDWPFGDPSNISKAAVLLTTVTYNATVDTLIGNQQVLKMYSLENWIS